MKFVKIKMYPVKDIQFDGYDGGFQLHVKLPVPEKARNVYLNLNEVAMLYPPESIRVFNRDGGVEKNGKWALIENGKTLELRGRGGVLKSSLCRNETLATIMLRNGIKTNLGLNGMDVDQTLYIDAESYSRMVKALELDAQDVEEDELHEVCRETALLDEEIQVLRGIHAESMDDNQKEHLEDILHRRDAHIDRIRELMGMDSILEAQP